MFDERVAGLGYYGELDDKLMVMVSRKNMYKEFSDPYLEPISFADRANSYSKVITLKGKPVGVVYFKQKPYFISRSEIYELRGSHPGDFNVYKVVDEGCVDKKTISFINSKMYYLSEKGVMEFKGGTPVLISSQLDNSIFKFPNLNACGATDGRYYYLSVNYNSINKLFVYDIQTKWWTEFEPNNILDMCYLEGFTNDNQPQIVMSTAKKLLGFNTDKENTEFSYTTSAFYTDALKPVCLKQVKLELEADNKADLQIYVSYNYGDFINVAKLKVGKRQVHSININPRKAYNIRLHISGMGDVKTHAICLCAEN